MLCGGSNDAAGSALLAAFVDSVPLKEGVSLVLAVAEAPGTDGTSTTLPLPIGCRSIVVDRLPATSEEEPF